MNEKISNDLAQLRQAADDVNQLWLIMGDLYPSMRVIGTTVKSLTPAFEVAGIDNRELVKQLHEAWVHALEVTVAISKAHGAMLDNIATIEAEIAESQDKER